MVFDVNTEYFERHGGYEYAKKFYAEAYELAKQIAGGEQYVISAVMHADERNREASDRLGKDVFHYHMHVIYLPVVEKEIRWSKRCRDPALRGTVRETVMQVSHSKKWPMVPATDETGRPVLKKDGRPRLISSYSLLQTAFYEHMKAAGFTDFERGIEGSTAEHLDVLEYKVKQDRQVVQELRQEIGDLGTQAEEARKQRDELRGEVTAAAGDLRAVQADIGDVRQMHGRSRRKALTKRIELPEDDYARLLKLAESAAGLQVENRHLAQELQNSGTMLWRLRREAEDTEERLHQLWMDTRSYREAVKIAPRRVSEFLSGVLREHRREQSVTRQSRTQQRSRDWEMQL